MLIQVVLPVCAEAGRLARRALDGQLSAFVNEATADDARAAATELVTNVVRYSGLAETDSMRLTATGTNRRVRVEVEQDSSAAGARLVPRGERADKDGGLGLRIVDHMASRWGVDGGPPGCVWFEVGPLVEAA